MVNVTVHLNAEKMLHCYMIEYNYRPKYLVVINENTYVSVYKCVRNKFDQSSKKNFIGKSKICAMTEFSRALSSHFLDGNTVLLECKKNKSIYISGREFLEFKTSDEIID